MDSIVIPIAEVYMVNVVLVAFGLVGYMIFAFAEDAAHAIVGSVRAAVAFLRSRQPRFFVITAAILLMEGSIFACVRAYGAEPATRPLTTMPSDARIAAERARIEAERKPMFADPDLGRSSTGNAFPNVPAPARGALDPMRIAQQYADRTKAARQEQLLAFASLSMPAPSLKRLINDTARVGGIVVLRGFKDRSFKATAAAVKALDVDTTAVQINPEAFKQYRIERVPAVVLVKSGATGADTPLDSEGCSFPENYAGVAGDVSLAYALQELGRRSPEYNPLAQRLLTSLGGH